LELNTGAKGADGAISMMVTKPGEGVAETTVDLADNVTQSSEV